MLTERRRCGTYTGNNRQWRNIMETGSYRVNAQEQ